jgi:5-methylcytosine-specific restriction protein A
MLNYIKNFVKSLCGVKQGPPLMVAHPRSTQWPKIRDEHLEMEPTCQACGTKKNLSVHHIMPYHLDRTKELDHSNLITLCEEHHCHLVFGHYASWYSYNPQVREDVKKWLERVKNRP